MSGYISQLVMWCGETGTRRFCSVCVQMMPYPGPVTASLWPQVWCDTGGRVLHSPLTPPPDSEVTSCQESVNTSGRNKWMMEKPLGEQIVYSNLAILYSRARGPGQIYSLLFLNHSYSNTFGITLLIDSTKWTVNVLSSFLVSCTHYAAWDLGCKSKRGVRCSGWCKQGEAQVWPQTDRDTSALVELRLFTTI